VSVALATLLLCRADESTHTYVAGEAVKLWANKVGPYHNPQETYLYHSLPYCRPYVHERKSRSLGDALEGNTLINTGIKISFLNDTDFTHMCTVKLNSETASSFQFAISHHYWYQMYIDELPVWAMVGEEQDAGTADHPTHLVYTHMKFSIGYKGNRIVEVNLTSEEPRPVDAGTGVLFSYGVQWVPVEAGFEQRWQRYLDYNFFEHQIHWFSIFNSFMMVIFLVGLVALILLRTLRQDYASMFRDGESEYEDLDRDLADETGWKKITGDVFREPSAFVPLCVMVAVGHQLLFLTFACVSAALVATMYAGRGAMIDLIVLFYAIGSMVGGYKSGSMYAQGKGKNWKLVMLLTMFAFPTFLFGVSTVLNAVALSYSAVMAIHLPQILTIVGIWLVTSLPLTIVGTILGRNWGGTNTAPCRVSPIPGYLPVKKWFLEPHVVIPLGGVLPFGSIFIEMYFVFTSFWNYKFYYVYGFMFLVAAMLVIVCACVAIVVTYFLLNAEDYHWQWPSFLCVSSTAFYVFLYGVYFFFTKTKMHGFFQTSFYFGYVTVFSTALFLVCGSIGYGAANLFVRRIYRDIKSD
jgi:transmembrane 9 superfamily protein 3